MKTVYLFIFSFWLSLVAAATSLKSPQTALLSNIRVLLEIYKSKHSDNLPENWREFVGSGIFTDQILNDSRRLLDIENRYIFVDLKPMQFGNQNERVLIMARQAGGEGNSNDAEDPEQRKGRWLFVEASDGSIQTRKYSEVMLKFWFEKAGLSLADFTSAAPPPPEFIPPPKEPNSEGMALGGPENPSDGSTRAVKNPSKREGKPRLPHSENGIDSIDFPSWVIWIAGGISLAAFLVWIVLRKRATR